MRSDFSLKVRDSSRGLDGHNATMRQRMAVDDYCTMPSSNRPRSRYSSINLIVNSASAPMVYMSSVRGARANGSFGILALGASDDD